MSNGLILNMYSGYNGVSRGLEKFVWSKVEMISYLLPEGQGAFYRP
jgi:hypothetical protein